MALRTVGVRLTAEISGYVSKLKQAQQTTKDFGNKLRDAADTGRLDSLADRAGVMGLGLAAGFGYAVKAAAAFDKEMSAVGAATHASERDMKALRAAALEAGKTTQYSATEAAKGITELSKAGVSTADVLNGGLKGALSLAAAGQLDVGEAAETAASAMTQFKLTGDKIPHVADLLASAAGKAQGSVHDMGAALNMTGLVAAQTGLSIEETTGGLAAFASAGLTGSDAGTSFKQMLMMLQAPSEKSAALMEELGITLYDNEGQFVGLTKFAGQLRTALKDLTPEARAAAMTQIFGADATRAASVMYEQGAEGIQQWIDKVNDAGYAQETAAKLTDNLAGDVEKLKGSLETMAIEAGSGANGGLRILVKALNALVDGFAALPSGVSATLTMMAGVGAALVLAAVGWVKLRRAIADTTTELRQVGPAGEKAATALERGSRVAGKAALAFGALEAASLGIKALTETAPNVDRLTQSLTELAATGKTTDELKNLFGEQMEDLGKAVQYADSASGGFWKFFNTVQSGIPIVNNFSDALSEGLFGTSFNEATEKTKALDAALTQYMEQTNDSRKASEMWHKVLLQSGTDLGTLAKILPDAHAKWLQLQKGTDASADSLKNLGTQTLNAKDATEKYATATEATTAAIKGQRDAFLALADAVKAETDPVFGLLDAQEKLTAAKKKASEATKKLGRDSAEAKAASRELALAAVDLQEKTGNLSSTFNGEMSPALRTTLKAAGLTEAQIRDVGKQFVDAKKKAEDYDGNYKANASTPGAVKAKQDLDKAYTAANNFAGPYRAVLSTPGYQQAEKNIQDAWNKAKGYDGNWVANIKTTGYSKVAEDLRHLLAAQHALKQGVSVNEANRELGHFFAAGGSVQGPGSGTSDSIPAWLSNGEFVVKADSVSKIGVSALEYMNKKGRLPGHDSELTPGYAGGGIVMPYPTTVSKTKIPEDQWSGSIGNAGPAGAGWKWMVAAVRAAFPGMGVYSTFRPGSRTLSGNRSYHSVGRAVDFAPSKPLAEWINANYFSRTKELITPWNSLNIHNGRRHTYTGAIFRQHNFAGGNAHDHWAMARGGTIREPIFGIGASGRTYSFGENYQPERVTPNWQAEGGAGGGRTIHLTVVSHGVIGSQAEAENFLVGAIDNLKRRGRL